MVGLTNTSLFNLTVIGSIDISSKLWQHIRVKIRPYCRCEGLWRVSDTGEGSWRASDGGECSRRASGEGLRSVQQRLLEGLIRVLNLKYRALRNAICVCKAR